MAMTGEQWIEVVDWVSVRWPNSQWHPEQAVAYFDDLARFDVSDVWAALFKIYERGTGFAPAGSELLAGAIREARETARYAAPALPEPSPEPTTWAIYSQNRFGEVLTPQEVIERLYADRMRREGHTVDA